MHIGIDASNLREGGGVTHLVELLAHADPGRDRFSRVTVWGSRRTLDAIGPRPWLERVHVPALDRALPARLLWRARRFRGELARVGVELLFVPGGSYLGRFRPMVTMSQNLLPFDARAARSYGWSKMRLKLALLRMVQSRTFQRASAVIFLTEEARRQVLAEAGPLAAAVAIIPHGVASRFARAPRAQEPLAAYSAARPFRLLYVSKVDMYKHQWVVAEAVAHLRKEGLPVALDFVGPAYPPALARLRDTLARLDARGEFLRYLGAVAYAQLAPVYDGASAFVFASSCENMPNILVEAMAAGLPIACSDRGVMPEVLGPGGVYFDPENAADATAAIRRLVRDEALRTEVAALAHERAAHFTWSRCTGETFSFIHAVVTGGASTAPSSRRTD